MLIDFIDVLNFLDLFDLFHWFPWFHGFISFISLISLISSRPRGEESNLRPCGWEPEERARDHWANWYFGGGIPSWSQPQKSKILDFGFLRLGPGWRLGICWGGSHPGPNLENPKSWILDFRGWGQVGDWASLLDYRKNRWPNYCNDYWTILRPNYLLFTLPFGLAQNIIW